MCGLGTIVASACLFYGFFIEPKTLKVRAIEFIEPGWEDERLTIALISDIHIGSKHVDAKRVSKIVERINTSKPDLVLIAGDFIGGHDKAADRSAAFNDEVEKGILALSNLDAPLGAYATIGNHDDWYDGATVKQLLLRAGVGVLDNNKKNIRSFCLVGLPDSWTGTADRNVFRQCGDRKIIAFMHSPDSFKYMPTHTSLAFAGHTHGGQINMPFVGRRVTATDIGRKFAYGRVDYYGIPGFITAGIGTSMLPARFRAPPEIVLISVSGPYKG